MSELEAFGSGSLEIPIFGAKSGYNPGNIKFKDRLWICGKLAEMSPVPFLHTLRHKPGSAYGFVCHQYKDTSEKSKG